MWQAKGTPPKAFGTNGARSLPSATADDVTTQVGARTSVAKWGGTLQRLHESADQRPEMARTRSNAGNRVSRLASRRRKSCD